MGLGLGFRVRVRVRVRVSAARLAARRPARAARPAGTGAVAILRLLDLGRAVAHLGTHTVAGTGYIRLQDA